MPIRDFPTPHIPPKLPITNVTNYFLSNKTFIQSAINGDSSLSRFIGYLQNIPNPTILISALTMQEAVLSSKIEGTIATIEDVLNNTPSTDIIKNDIKEIENYKDYNTWYNNDLVKIKNNLLMLKKFYENLTEKQFDDLEKLQKTNLGYKGSYGTVIEIYLKNGKYSSHRLTAFCFSLCEVKDYSTPWLDHVNEIDTVIEKQELDIINKNFDFTALERLNKKINNFKHDENATWETICIKSYKELINLLKKLNIYEDYLKEQEQFKEDTELLNNPKLKEVKFSKYRSWETGGKFLILNEQVDKTTFSKLSKAGMYYHHYHADNEERFNGYCIEDTLENKIKLAKLGLKSK